MLANALAMALAIKRHPPRALYTDSQDNRLRKTLVVRFPPAFLCFLPNHSARSSKPDTSFLVTLLLLCNAAAMEVLDLVLGHHDAFIPACSSLKPSFLSTARREAIGKYLARGHSPCSCLFRESKNIIGLLLVCEKSSTTVRAEDRDSCLVAVSIRRIPRFGQPVAVLKRQFKTLRIDGKIRVAAAAAASSVARAPSARRLTGQKVSNTILVAFDTWNQAYGWRPRKARSIKAKKSVEDDSSNIKRKESLNEWPTRL
nr:DUF21 domain-containing protein At4g14240-like [Ipomoea batatas]